MFRTMLRRRWVGASAVLIAGLTTGCRNVQTSNSCTTGNCGGVASAHVGKATAGSMAVAPPTASPAPPIARPTPMPMPGKVIAPSLPINDLPSVRSEKRIEPDKNITSAVPDVSTSEKFPLPTPPIVTGEKTSDALPPTAGAPQSPPTSTPTAEVAKRRSFPDITARPEFRHSADHTELTGELILVPHKNQWRLRYCSIDEEDRYGGSVTLNGNHEFGQFKAGQIVKVYGEMLNKESREPSPPFRVRSIELVK